MLTESYEACFKGKTGKTNVYSEADLKLKVCFMKKILTGRTPVKKISSQKEHYHQRVNKQKQ